MENYVGTKVKVFDKKGIVVGASQQYNGSYVVLMEGENKEIHHQNIRDINDGYLKWIP